MMKRIRLLYSDSKQGIAAEVAEFKQEIKERGYRYIKTHYIKHKNGHYTALARYKGY